MLKNLFFNCHQLKQAAIEKGFIQKVMDRYYSVLGQKLYWVSVVTSAQFETGFSYENAWNGTNFSSPHPYEYDYLLANVNQFRTCYLGLAGVNTAYGTNYSNLGQVQPAKVNVNSLDNMTNANVQAMYNSLLFEDWYKFNYKQMKSFLLECKEVIKTANPNIKFCFEAGSNTDQLCAARKTFNIHHKSSDCQTKKCLNIQKMLTSIVPNLLFLLLIKLRRTTIIL